MQRSWGDRVRFLTVYIKEAHPEDEWQMESNEDEGVCYPQPKNLEERLRIANDFQRRFDYELPLVVDGMDNGAMEAYAGWPERLYVLVGDEVALKGGMGPFGFDPEAVEVWLRDYFGEPR